MFYFVQYPRINVRWDLLRRAETNIHLCVHLPCPADIHHSKSLGKWRGCQSEAKSGSIKSSSRLWGGSCCWMMNWPWDGSSREGCYKKRVWVKSALQNTAPALYWLLSRQGDFLPPWLSSLVPVSLAVADSCFWSGGTVCHGRPHWGVLEPRMPSCIQVSGKRARGEMGVYVTFHSAVESYLAESLLLSVTRNPLSMVRGYPWVWITVA